MGKIKSKRLLVGDWIVEDSEGKYSVVEDDKFKVLFELL